MAKRLMVSLGMLALLLTTAVPVLAQEEEAQYGGGEVSATGVIFDDLPADAGGFGTHSISDDATGTTYALRSAGPDLDSYGSQRVTVHGALTPGEEGSGEEGIEGNGTLPSIDVSRVEPAGGVEPGPRIVAATGVLGEPYTPGEDPTPVYDLADEATGKTYTLFDIGAGLDAFVGQRVTVEGTRSPGIDPLALDVTSVVPAGGSPGEGGEIDVAFELDADCAPPAGTTFFGLAGQQPAALSDPEGVGVYTGSLELSADFGTFPIPVWITTGTPEIPNQQVIKSFGEMVLEDGDAFSASVACDGDGATPIGGGGTTSGPGDGGSGSGNNGSGTVDKGGSGSVSTGDGAVVSGDTNNANKGGGAVPAPDVDLDENGAIDEADGAVAAEVSASAGSDASASAAKVLPATGGVLPIAGAVGALLVLGGIVARRMFS